VKEEVRGWKLRLREGTKRVELGLRKKGKSRCE
jgi:hypothetical protein